MSGIGDLSAGKRDKPEYMSLNSLNILNFKLLWSLAPLFIKACLYLGLSLEMWLCFLV